MRPAPAGPDRVPAPWPGLLATSALAVLGCGDAAGDRCDPGAFEGTPFAAEVVTFQPGAWAGFGADRLPCVVLGPPAGAGTSAGSIDVLSLGDDGSVTLRLGRPAIDGPGPDLLVFENPFLIGGGTVPFAEPGEVAVSADGETFFPFPCEPENADAGFPGCAGVRPVLAGPDRPDRDPTDPTSAGGDAFDLADLGLSSASYVRVRDLGFGRGGTAEDGNRGVDLDAVAAVHTLSGP